MTTDTDQQFEKMTAQHSTVGKKPQADAAAVDTTGTLRHARKVMMGGPGLSSLALLRQAKGGTDAVRGQAAPSDRGTCAMEKMSDLFGLLKGR